MIIDEIDKKREQTITPFKLDEFFGMLWSMPNDAYKLQKGQRNMESNLLFYRNPEEVIICYFLTHISQYRRNKQSSIKGKIPQHQIIQLRTQILILEIQQ
jgi:hypothetical protein